MVKPDDFIGMNKSAAQYKAERANLIFRLIRIDGANYFDYPEDSRTDRICIEIDNGAVTKAVIN
jgi:hypothetical protein